jgi:hypothetical protein
MIFRTDKVRQHTVYYIGKFSIDKEPYSILPRFSNQVQSLTSPPDSHIAHQFPYCTSFVLRKY